MLFGVLKTTFRVFNADVKLRQITFETIIIILIFC